MRESGSRSATVGIEWWRSTLRTGLLLLCCTMLSCAAESGSSGKACAEPSDLESFTVFTIDLDAFVETTDPRGVCYRDETVPEGGRLVQVGDVVSTSITGYAPDDTLIENSEVSFEVGLGEVLPGIDLGVREMKAGGLRVLVIAPELAYGSAGTTGVSPDSVVIYLVQVNTITCR